MTEISTDVFQMKKLFSLHIWTDVEGIKTQLTWAREIKKKKIKWQRRQRALGKKAAAAEQNI